MPEANHSTESIADEFSPVFFPERAHLLIQVSGTVQGVGFRPFVFGLARSHRIAGNVRNHSGGVTIHAQGTASGVQAFLCALKTAAPPAARIETISTAPLPLNSFTDFSILASEVMPRASTHVPPDLALCSACRAELSDRADRRFEYPFINCINCGPRFTIIESLPYDRPLTTMRGFALCDACRVEYTNPADRRFHTQPVSCPDCGPKLTFKTAVPDGWRDETADDPLTAAAAAIDAGRIVLIQGIGGFHLACDARREDVVQILRQRKRRDEKPLAVMYPSLEDAAADCEISTPERDALLSVRAPIVLLRKLAHCSLAPSIAPDNPRVGVMVPYSPLHALLLRRHPPPIVLTSANLSDEPIAYQTEDALSRMKGIADAALLHDRPIHMFADDSVMRVVRGKPRVWRRSRGFVPEAVKVRPPFHAPVLAFGPHLKNTFCLGIGDNALLSQHLGDLENAHSLRAHAAAVDHLLRLYSADVRRAACDLHPDYASTRLAEEWSALHGVPLVRVQHHHAHLAACLAEHGCMQPVIGLCLDGTGYGTDGSIWGGEVLIGDARSFRRFAHLEEVPLLGGEAAAREPWRMALAWLYETFGDEWQAIPLPWIEQVRRDIGTAALSALLNPRLRLGIFPRTSSLGRLFDAVASLTVFGLRPQFEGQAAMLLEGVMATTEEAPYPMEISTRHHETILSATPLLRALLADLAAGIPAPVISRRFHEAVVDGYARLCGLARNHTGLQAVALTGGCFQNAFVLAGLEERLDRDGFEVLSHADIPAGDGGVALGQAVIANAQEDC